MIDKELEKNYAKKEIILQEDIKENRIRFKVYSKCFYEFIIEVDTPKNIIFQDLINGIFEGLYLQPTTDITFYFIMVKSKKYQKKEEKICNFGLTEKSYLIYLDEKKYIEKSLIIKAELYDFIHKSNHFQQTPFYLPKTKEDSFIDKNKKCTNKVKEYNYLEENIEYLPIIIIKKEDFSKAINFLRSYYKYKEFQNITILIDKLIKPTTEKYIINHAPNKSIATLFMETTDSNNYEDYLKNKNEIKKIINLIKEQADKDKLVFQNNNFKKDMEKWVRTVFIIMAEYIQFLLRIKPIYYICNNCFYPVIFFDNKEYKSYIDKIKNKLNKNINEIKIVNSFIYMIIPSFFKNPNLPEVNVLYYDEHYSKSDCNVLKSSISGCFILSKNLSQLTLILKEIKKKCSNNNNIKFQLIISGISCQKVLHYILEKEKQQKYIDFIDNLCIYSKIEIDSYEDIKQLCLNNNKKIEIYKHIELIVNIFLKTICTKTPSQCYTYTKVIKN